MVQEVEHFYGVYLLYNINPKFKGRTYIGFTVDPNRRVKQHNTGKHAGGAWRTSGKGPWEMILITHGFPNEISALRFEWAWQHPERSRRLRHLPKKSRKESAYDFRFRIFWEMLRTGPWNRLSLTVRWLKQEYKKDFPLESVPPLHIAIAYGPVKAVKLKGATSTRKKQKGEVTTDTEGEVIHVESPDSPAPSSGKCSICSSEMKDKDSVRCYQPGCKMTAHMICLSRSFLQGEGDGEEQVIPVGGCCPGCSQDLLWGDVVRHKLGCFLALENQETPSDSHWANELAEPL